MYDFSLAKTKIEMDPLPQFTSHVLSHLFTSLAYHYGLNSYNNLIVTTFINNNNNLIVTMLATKMENEDFNPRIKNHETRNISWVRKLLTNPEATELWVSL